MLQIPPQILQLYDGLLAKAAVPERYHSFPFIKSGCDTIWTSVINTPLSHQKGKVYLDS